MMKNVIKEKQATLDVINSILGAIDWTIDSKKADLTSYAEAKKAEEEAAAAEGRDVNPANYRWQKQEAEDAERWLAAWATVEKHLEKLI